MAETSAAPALDQYSKGVRAWFPDKDEAWIGAELIDKEVRQQSMPVLSSTHASDAIDLGNGCQTRLSGCARQSQLIPHCASPALVLKRCLC